MATDLIATVFAGVAFGLALAAPPGPMNAVIAEESVVRGWAAGVVTGLGAMVADACFFFLALLGAATVVRASPTLRAAMVLAGGCLMLYFAYEAVTEAGGFGTDDTAAAADPPSDARTASLRGFRKAFLLAITNPYQIAFWLTVGVGLLEPGTVDVLARTPYVGPSLAGAVVVRTGSPLLIVGLFAGIAVWVTAFPAALSAAGRRVDRLAPLVAGASAVVLAGSGIYFLIDGVETLT